MISVIIPLYNKEKCIDKTIQSVLIQTYSDFELVIVDDGSTDESVVRVKKFNDKRITLLQKENGGVSSARNFGIKHSKGEFIFLLDADDFLFDNCLEILFHYIVEFNADLSTANYVTNSKIKTTKKICKGENVFIVKDIYKSIWYTDIIPRTGCTLVKREVFDNTNFDERISFYEDLDLIMRLFNGKRIIYSPEIVFSYNNEFSELSRKLAPLNKEFAYYISFANTSFYQKILLGENIYLSLRRRISTKDKESIAFFKRKYRKYIAVIIFAALWRKSIKILEKLR